MCENRIDFTSLAVPGVQKLQPYQPGKPESELKREYGLDHVVKLASNENPLGPSDSVKQAIQSVMGELSRYPDGNGFELKHALANKHGVPTECITLGNGSNDVLELLARGFLRPGDNAVFSAHAFAVYPLATMAVGAECNIAPALAEESDQPFGHDLKAMLAAINDKTRLVFVANPNNPTGTWLEADALKAFISQVPSNVLVVVDQAYIEFTEGTDFPNAVAWVNEFPNLVVTQTFSKAYGIAGLRVGFSISHPQVADILNRVRQPFNCSLVAQEAAVAALADTDYIKQSVELNNQGMAYLTKSMNDLGLGTIASKGNFLCVKVGANSLDTYESLLREGVIVRPVANYQMPEYLRVSIGLQRENEAFVTALKKVMAL